MFFSKKFCRYLLTVLLFCLPYVIDCVPFVTKRVSLPQNIKFDFTGWRPLPDRISERSEVETDQQTITIPVAVETDEEHELSSTDLNAIEERVIETWRQKQNLNVDSLPEHLSPFLSKLIPNQQQEEDAFRENENRETYTFVKMTPNEEKSSEGDQKEVLFHAYLADGDHEPEEGYVKLTKSEFRQLFSDAEIHFI